MRRSLRYKDALIVLLVFTAACDGGLAPPADDTTPGTIVGTVTYTGAWPSADSLFDLRFVAMRFVPRDSSDFFQLARLVFSDARLDYFVAADSFVVSSAPPGDYLYAGVAQRYTSDITAWRPVAIYTDGGGRIRVPPGDTVRVALTVDFSVRPPWPPAL